MWRKRLDTLKHPNILIDLLVFNANFSSISAILWHELTLEINFHIYQTLRNKTFIYKTIVLYIQITEKLFRTYIIHLYLII